jgi:hypothetical protein
MRRHALLAIVLLAATPALAGADEQMDSAFHLSDWAILGMLSGKYVVDDGSHTKFLEDYNVQSGVDGGLTLSRKLDDDGTSARIEALGQSGEEQGYFIGDYRRLNRYSLLVDVNASQRFYNARDGEQPRLDFFPLTNDGRVVYGDDDPSIHRLTAGAKGVYKPQQLFRDVYLDFHYQGTDGEETLRKGGTIGDPAAFTNGSGPGTTAFDFPARKGVQYRTFNVATGGRSPLGDVNWQTDATYQHASIESQVVEPNFRTSFATSEVERYKEDSEVNVATYDLVGSRFLNPDVYVYGGYLFSFEHNAPSPSQTVSDNGRSDVTGLVSRDTSGGDVHRLGNTLGMGVLYHPHRDVVLTANTRARGYLQSGDIRERRDEFTLGIGDVGAIRNSSDRDLVESATDVAATWTPMARTLVRGFARYRYRKAFTDTTRSLNFVQVETTEDQNYDTDYSLFEAGPSVRWSAGHGRAVEAGYSFFYENADVSIDQLVNEYIQNDYTRRRHRPYLTATARIRPNLRGELRFEYVNEHRNLRPPQTDPISFTGPGHGETNWETYRVTPSMFYQPTPEWNLYGSVGVSQDRLSVGNLGVTPANFRSFRDFEYDALTETVAVGAGYAPSERWSLSGAYTYVHSGHGSVGNDINRGELVGTYKVTDTWSLNGGYRYLRYDDRVAKVDEYRAHVPFVGVTGRF